MADRRAMDDMLAQAREIAQGNLELLASMTDDIERMFRRQRRFIQVTDLGNAEMDLDNSSALSDDPPALDGEGEDAFGFVNSIEPTTETEPQSKDQTKGKEKEKGCERDEDAAGRPPSSSKTIGSFRIRRGGVSTNRARAKPPEQRFADAEATRFRQKILEGRYIHVPGPAELEEYEDAAIRGRAAGEMVNIIIGSEMTLEDFIDDQIRRMSPRKIQGTE